MAERVDFYSDEEYQQALAWEETQWRQQQEEREAEEEHAREHAETELKEKRRGELPF